MQTQAKSIRHGRAPIAVYGGPKLPFQCLCHARSFVKKSTAAFRPQGLSLYIFVVTASAKSSNPRRFRQFLWTRIDFTRGWCSQMRLRLMAWRAPLRIPMVLVYPCATHQHPQRRIQSTFQVLDLYWRSALRCKSRRLV
jgi:hypothetical protein